MTVKEAEEYYETLDAKQATRFNLLVEMYMKFGKPIEGAYEAAKTVMEEEKNG